MTDLVVLPGFDGTATLLSAFSDAVDCAFDSVTILSYPTAQVLGYAELESLARAALPRGTRFVLLGESFSGPIALSIAATPPAGLVGLVLSTSFARSPIPLLSPLASFARFAPVRALPFPLLSWWLLGRWSTPQLESALRDALLSVTPSVLRARAITALRANVSSCLRAISVPTLYLRATQDRLLSRSSAAHILSAVAPATCVEITGPHLLLQAAPHACALAVGKFSRTLS